MAPGQKEAQEALFKPQKFTNDPPPYHPDAYKKAGLAVPPESIQHHQNQGDSEVEEEMSMDDFGQRAEMISNEESAPANKRYNPLEDPKKKDWTWVCALNLSLLFLKLISLLFIWSCIWIFSNLLNG